MSSADVISKDGFTKMIQQMDKDGDGSVDKEEFKPVYTGMFPDTTDEQYEKIWKEVDKDGDGNLTVRELAEFYGFSWDDENGSAADMTDEQILSVLAMSAAAAALLDAATPTVVAPADEPKAKTRDETIVLVNSDLKKNKDPTKVEDMIKLHEAIALGELTLTEDEKTKGEKESVETLLAKGVCVRFMDEKNETPLHKLARLKLAPGNNLYKKVFLNIVNATREQARAAGRPQIHSDINHQCKEGKTPLAIAVEFGNIPCITLLCELGRDGPDFLLVNQAGWTIVHNAAQKHDLEVIKTLFKHLSVLRKKLLLGTKDKTGRTPLHIASFKDDTEDAAVVSFFLENGAKDAAAMKDTAGNTAAKLADRAGRRVSKELLEEITEPKVKTRRNSRDSRESTEGAEAKE